MPVIGGTKAIVIVGQSLGVNALGPTHYTPRNASILKQLNVNDGTVSAASEPFLGVTNPDSTFYLELADLMADTRRWSQIVIAPIAIAATLSAEWSLSGDCYYRIAAVIPQLKALKLDVGLFIQVQGEEDAQHTNVLSEFYRTNWMFAQRAFRNAGFKAPWLIPNESWVLSGLQANAAAVRGGQRALCGPEKRAFLGPDFDNMGNSYRRDGTHPNDYGKSEMARLLLPYALRLMH